MSREHVTDQLCIDHKNHQSFYLKTGCEGTYIRRPKTEYEGYKLLSPHLRMPRVKLADTVIGPVLVVQGIDAPSASSMLTTDPDALAETLNGFLSDVYSMWQNTGKPMEIEKLSRNWKTETTSTLLKLKKSPLIQEIEDLPIVVNGCTYPCLKSTMNRCLTRLTTVREPTMVLCHGDEHLGNLLSGEDGYWVIDPGNYTGYNTPSSLVNNLVGGTYLFEYRYTGEHSITDGTFSVEYALTEEFVGPEKVMQPVFRTFEDLVIDLVNGDSLSKELLFINELRVALGWTKRRMDLSEIKKAGMLYTGLATEHYYAASIV